MTNEQPLKTIPSALQQAGVQDLKFTGNTMTLTEMTGMAIVRAHSFPQSVPAELPITTGQVAGGDPCTLCVRPNEWLFVSDSCDAKKLLKQVEGKFDLQNTAVYKQSDGLAVFRLQGSGAPWLLSKLSGLDFLSGTSAGPHCARTRMGHVAVVIHYHQAEIDEFVFDLIFDRSIAKYLWDLLIASSPHADDLTHAFGTAA